jgi:hypothetical protein
MIYDFLSPYLFIRKGSRVNLVNETKFLQVVTLWFNYFDYTIDFILNNGKDINLLKNDLIKKSSLPSFDVFDDDCRVGSVEKNSFFYKFLSFFLFGKKGYLPSGVSTKIVDKIKFRLLSYRVENLKIKVNYEFKNAYFEECNKRFDQETVVVLRDIIPDIFFASGLLSDYNLPLTLKGSPLSFFDFNYSYLKLLLQSKKVKILGIQHGGVYGEWNNNPYENYENKISDSYYGWGLFEQNIIQNRFKRNKKIGYKQQGVFWFGRNESYLPIKVNFGNEIFEHYNDINHIPFFYKYFKEFDLKFLPHPRKSLPIYKDVIDNSISVLVEDSAAYVSNARLIVFDCLSHTLMYYCLFNRIPFVIVLDNWPLKGLSAIAMEFYEVLYKNNLLLIKNDNDLFKKLDVLKEYLNGNTVDFYDDEFVSYIDKKFFSHKTIDLI